MCAWGACPCVSSFQGENVCLQVAVFKYFYVSQYLNVLFGVEVSAFNAEMAGLMDCYKVILNKR